MTKEELQQMIQTLEDQLEAATDLLNDILINEFELKPGMTINHGYKKMPVVVSSIRIKYGSPRAFAKKVRKDGTLGIHEFEVYGTYEIV